MQLGLDRSAADLRGLLPAGYEPDATQRFNAAEAATMARRTGVPRVAGLATDRFGRLGTFLSKRLQNNLRVGVATEVVPDAQLLERIRATMAAGNPPDFVIGDESLAANLQRLEYGTDFIRL